MFIYINMIKLLPYFLTLGYTTKHRQSKQIELKDLEVIFVLWSSEVLSCINVFFFSKFLTMCAALKRKLLNQFPRNLRQTYQLGYFICTQTPT